MDEIVTKFVKENFEILIKIWLLGASGIIYIGITAYYLLINNK